MLRFTFQVKVCRQCKEYVYCPDAKPDGKGICDKFKDFGGIHY